MAGIYPDLFGATAARAALLRRAAKHVLVSRQARADFPVGRYAEFLKVPSFKDYLVGVGRGVFWSNVMLKVRSEKPFFCMPSRLALDEGIILSLINQEITKPSSGKPWKADTSVEMVMVVAFMTKFPCDK